eukprot:CAMPEP_0203847662 /NCGR_PEP_ID=MMETSP0359-20131031/5139_1 /ASSEMBLY_ACC=CAM_ASM_000338 /TAXON_ID=268821 /ORGANISM="Scrippsiella Hangoei, Strain SHTV-5" /LENGTH=859 /DNA_ID=CAMNT_0050763149 /DNA_START=29 /DNA_END=2608 /DNA_ORIENTATION=-
MTARLAGYAKRLRALDQRFESTEDEAGFASSREIFIVYSLAVSTSCAVLIVPFSSLFMFGLEFQREDSPLTLSFRDPRTVSVMSAMSGWVISVCFLALACARLWFGKFAWLCFEKVMIVAFSILCLHMAMLRTWNAHTLKDRIGWMNQNGQNTTSIWASNPVAAEGQHVLFIDLIITFVGFFAPARMHHLILMLLGAFCTYAMDVAIFGSPDTVIMPLQLITLFFLASFAVAGAWKNERNERATWMRGKELKEQKHELEHNVGLATGMQAIADRLCDLVFHLSEELIVCDQEVKHTSFFFRPLFGEHFASLISEDDQHRFRTLISQASCSRQPQCMHLTLLCNGEMLEAEILAVDIDKAHCKYIIGIRVDAPLRLNEGTEVAPVGWPEDSQPARGQSSVSGSTRPETTFTGLVFESGRAQDILKLGRAEHWLLAATDIFLVQPVRVLGRGGFGVVVAGLFHGKGVAIKVATPTEGQQRILPALANELRAIRCLRHPNIVLFHGVVFSAELTQMSIVYEFVNGPTLDHLVAHSSPSPTPLARFGLVFDILCALRYLHSQRPALVHGDLKGNNAKTLGGTRAWHAPETRTTTSSDVFSFGWLVHLVTTGQRPFGGKRGKDLDDAVRQMLFTKSVGALPMPLGSPFLENSKAMSEECLKFEPWERPEVTSLFESLPSWVSMEEKCELGCDIAQSMLPAGLGRGASADSPSRPPVPSVSDVDSARLAWHELPHLDAAEVQFEVEATFTLRIASEEPAHLPDIGAVATGASLAELLVDGDFARLWLCAIANDVADGLVSVPFEHRFGRVCLRPSGVAANIELSAELAAAFPKANRMATIRLSAWLCRMLDHQGTEEGFAAHVSL